MTAFPVPRPSPYASIRQKLDWAALEHYVRLCGKDREEAQSAILAYAHQYQEGDVDDLRQALAHMAEQARAVREQIARAGR